MRRQRQDLLENLQKFLRKNLELAKDQSDIRPDTDEIDKITFEILNILTPFEAYEKAYKSVLDWQNNSISDGPFNRLLTELIETLEKSGNF